MAWAADVGVRKSLTARFASELVEILKVSAINILMAPVRVISAEWGRIVSDTEMPLTFVKSRYPIGGYIPVIPDIGLENGYICKPL